MNKDIGKCRFCGFEYEATETCRADKSPMKQAVWAAQIRYHKIPVELQNGPLGKDGVCCMCSRKNESDATIIVLYNTDTNSLLRISDPKANYKYVIQDIDEGTDITEGLSDINGIEKLFKNTCDNPKLNFMVKTEEGKWGAVVGIQNELFDEIEQANLAADFDINESVEEPQTTNKGAKVSNITSDFDLSVSGKIVNEPAKPEPTVQVGKQFTSRPLFATFFGEVPPIDQLAFVNIITVLNGVFEVRPVGSFIFTKCISVPSYMPPVSGSTILQTGIYAGPPLIPLSYLTNLVTFFRKVYEKFGTEAIAKIFYSHTDKKYKIWIPRQVVKETTVKWENTDANKEELTALENTGHEWVMDIHSHAGMDAFFSSGGPGTDDEDEKNDGIYGVVGQVGTASPQILFRLRIGSTFHDIETSELFDIATSEIDFTNTISERVFTDSVPKTQPTLSQTSTIPVNKSLVNVNKETAIIGKPSTEFTTVENNNSNERRYFHVHFLDGTKKVFEANDPVICADGSQTKFITALAQQLVIQTPKNNYSVISVYELLTPSQLTRGTGSSNIIKSAIASLPWVDRSALAKELTLDIISDTITSVTKMGVA